MTTKEDKVMCCSLKRCSFDGKINCFKDARVEVKAFLPESCRSSTKQSFIIVWKMNGDAVFHDPCWEKALKAARARNKRRSPFPEMVQLEKSLVKDASKTAEYFDSQNKLEEQATRIAKLLKDSKHCAVFSGAGISTSAGIGDYRGRNGKWTNEDHSRSIDETGTNQASEPPAKHAKIEELEESSVLPEAEVDYEELRPTYTHEAIQTLMEMGYIKYVISQNCDGLHTLSGISAPKVSELHGNVFIEVCEKCQTSFHRPYYVMDDTASSYYEELAEFGKTAIVKPHCAKKCPLCGLTHRTGRKCEKQGCHGYLNDTIINFNDNLDESVLNRAINQSQASDLMLCLGTTLTVTPASTLVEMTKQPQRIIICNRQKTHLDKACLLTNEDGEALGSRVFGDCDDLMKLVMREMMSPEELSVWEGGRRTRMAQYAEYRKQTANPQKEEETN